MSNATCGKDSKLNVPFSATVKNVLCTEWIKAGKTKMPLIPAMIAIAKIHWRNGGPTVSARGVFRKNFQRWKTNAASNGAATVTTANK